MNMRLSVNIAGLKLENPVMVASGTFGYAEEFKDLVELKKLGALVTKTITLNPHSGNPPPRTCETPAGMLNSIGLENPGLEVFLREKLPFLNKIGVPIIMSIASKDDPEEFIILARRINALKEIAAVELNISCPNLKSKIPTISQNAAATYTLVRKIRKLSNKILITKLSPNVTNIVEIARAAERAGSDALSLINTLKGMSIDTQTREPKISMVIGGLSGPAIRPVALRMVWEVYQRIKIPIIGMGGIMDAQSALEFFIAGATAISIGTANFINPKVSIEILEGIKKYLIKNRIKNIKTLIGSLRI